MNAYFVQYALELIERTTSPKRSVSVSDFANDEYDEKYVSDALASLESLGYVEGFAVPILGKAYTDHKIYGLTDAGRAHLDSIR